MANELMRSGQKYLANNDDRKIRQDAGEGLVIAGAGGIALMGVAALVPFVGALTMMITAVLLGLFMMLKK